MSNDERYNNNDSDMRERMVRLEVTSENIKGDVAEIKGMFSEHSKATTEAMASLSVEVKSIADSHIAFKNDIAGRIWGMRAAWAGIIGIAALVWKLIQNQQA